MATLAASIATVGGTTLLSRILGFARDLIVARLFGADAGTDAFFVAFKAPNFMRRLFAEGAFSMAFVPVLNDYRERSDPGALKRFVDDTAGTLGLLLLAITVLGVLAAPVLVLIFAPGFAADPEQLLLATDMLRLTFPYLFFIGLAAFAGSVLNVHRRFGVPAFTPVLLNLVIIGCAVWLAPRMAEPIVALAWGVFFGGIVQFGFQLPFLARLGLLPRPRFAPKDPGVRRIGHMMLPAIFGVSASQISLMLDTLLASFLVTGSISWLYYSDRLMEFPLGILGAAIGTVILPHLSRQHTSRPAAEFSETLDWALRWVMLLALPAAVGLFVLAGPIIATLFQSGAFVAHDVLMAERSLMAYSLGLVGFVAIKVLAPGFYSRQDTRTPVRIAVIALVVNLMLSLALMFPLGHAGLALATVAAALVNAGLLLSELLRQGIYRPLQGWRRLIAGSLAASSVMALALWLLSGPTLDWTVLDTGDRIARLSALLAVGGALYAATALATGIRPRHLSERAPSW
ncbi:MAG: murein biosynthesis integral membrane protein MurJ [Thiohalocapsa sp.]|nr:murein biosynthesis integral membrane protein MurJ [Thiohalocapsa sp.]MCF7990278.1 murein biosynthesis integral membrane protein MurJ [Thiohalocapsa sp.]